MTQEEKQLLLIDISARLPYCVEAQVSNNIDGETKSFVVNKELTFEDVNSYINNDVVCDIKPYLRPMSSMTEEEREHLQTLHDIISDENYGDGFSPAAWEAILDFNNYCREHYLDNGGLITLGLALEAPRGMYS